MDSNESDVFAEANPTEDAAKKANDKFQSGMSYCLKAEYEQAIAEFTAALRLDPTNPGIYSARGNAYRLICNYGLALKDLSAAIRIAPTNAVLLNRRCLIHRKMSNLNASVEDCSSALQLDPKNIECPYSGRFT